MQMGVVLGWQPVLTLPSPLPDPGPLSPEASAQQTPALQGWSKPRVPLCPGCRELSLSAQRTHCQRASALHPRIPAHQCLPPGPEQGPPPPQAELHCSRLRPHPGAPFLLSSNSWQHWSHSPRPVPAPPPGSGPCPLPLLPLHPVSGPLVLTDSFWLRVFTEQAGRTERGLSQPGYPTPAAHPGRPLQEHGPQAPSLNSPMPHTSCDLSLFRNPSAKASV